MILLLAAVFPPLKFKRMLGRRQRYQETQSKEDGQYGDEVTKSQGKK